MSKYEIVKEAYERFGYPFYTKPYSINIFGVRNASDEVNEFNDVIGVAYIDSNGNEICEAYEGTTKAGKTVLGSKMGNIKGTAILPTGWYNNLWKIGYHKGKYKALKQYSKIEVIRDYDLDGKHSYDSDRVDYGMFGINCHHANSSETHPSQIVNNWSWGCQVLRKINSWNKFFRIVKKSATLYGDKFSYSLFDDKMFDGELVEKLKKGA